jgi:hypothetical protein
MKSRTHVFSIISVVLISFIVIVLLYVTMEAPLRYAQGFHRDLRYSELKQRRVFELDAEGYYYLAGIADGEILLGNEKDSLGLMSINIASGSKRRIQIRMANDKLSKLNASYYSVGSTIHHPPRLSRNVIEVDSPYFFIKAKDLPGIFEGRLGQWEASRVADGIPFFSSAVPMGRGAFAFTFIGSLGDSILNKNMIGKISEGAMIGVNGDILEAEVDKYFSTLGTLRYSKKLDQLIYIYAYRNQYLIIDNKLKVLNKWKTIDTLSHPHIKPKQIADNRFLLGSTPAIVNNTAEIHRDLLFVQSNIMATNESRSVFDQTTAIDVYNIRTNTYRSSFYLPDYHAIKLTSYRIIHDRIIAQHGKYLILYALPVNLLKDLAGA